MSDETLVAAPELETAAPVAEVQPEAELEEVRDDSSPDGDETEEQPEDDGFDDLEWEGVKARVPREMKADLEARLGHFSKHFTTKTQETAALRRELEQGKETLAQQLKASDEELQSRAALVSIDAQIKSFENVDWDKWEAEDLFAAQQGFRKFQQLQAARGQVATYLGEQQKARTDAAQQETVKRLQATAEYAQKNIKGWTPEVDAKLTDFATQELGFDRDALKSAYTPQIYRALHLAWLGHQALSQKPAASPKPAPQPLKVVAAKANPPAVKDLGKMSMEEYASYRQKQMGRG